MIRKKVTETTIAYTTFVEEKDIPTIEQLIDELYGEKAKEEHSYFNGEEDMWDILYGYATSDKGIVTFWNGTEDVIIKRNGAIITSKEKLLEYVKGGF